jgi:hypothetical protein
MRATGPVGPHVPLDPNVLAALPRRPVTLEPSPRSAPVQLSIEGSVPQVLHECMRMFTADKLAEATRRRAHIIGGILIALGILTIWIFGLGLIPLIIGIVVWIRGNKKSVEDLEDRRLEVITGTLATLAPELKSNKPVKAIADFSGCDARQATAHEEAGTGWFEQRRTRSSYSHWWLVLRMMLQDGVAVEVDGTTLLSRKTAAKRKYTKTKDRVTERLVVRLVPPRGKAFPPHTLGVHPMGRMAAGMTLRQATVRPRGAVLVFQTAPAMRISGRGLVAHRLEGLLDSAKVVAAIVHSYKLVAKVGRQKR